MGAEYPARVLDRTEILLGARHDLGDVADQAAAVRAMSAVKFFDEVEIFELPLPANRLRGRTSVQANGECDHSFMAPIPARLYSNGPGHHRFPDIGTKTGGSHSLRKCFTVFPGASTLVIDKNDQHKGGRK